MPGNEEVTLPLARRFEAAGLRSWPAAHARYDGAWVIRNTPAYPSSRLNSVNFLDPGDVGDIEQRVERAREIFTQYGSPLTFRISPLAGSELTDYCDAEGWSLAKRSSVLLRSLRGLPLDDAVDAVPMQDVDRFARASARIHGEPSEQASGLAGVIRSITGVHGLFCIGDEDEPVATVICVIEGDAVGIFGLATIAAERSRGHGRRALFSALKWAHARGARQVWLQVEDNNAAAMGLYNSLGFERLYGYHYRQPRSAM